MPVSGSNVENVMNGQGKLQTGFVEVPPGAIVITGELPSSYMEAGTRGNRLYRPADSRTANVTGFQFMPYQLADIGPHTGVRYKIVVEPIGLGGQGQ